MIKSLCFIIAIFAVILAATGFPVMEYKEYFVASLIAAIIVPRFLIN